MKNGVVRSIGRRVFYPRGEEAGIANRDYFYVEQEKTVFEFDRRSGKRVGFSRGDRVLELWGFVLAEGGEEREIEFRVEEFPDGGIRDRIKVEDEKYRRVKR